MKKTTCLGAAATLLLTSIVGQANNQTVQLKKSEIKSAVLQACLKPWLKSSSHSVTISEQTLQKNCVIPYINGAWLSTDWLLRTPQMINQEAHDKLMRPPRGLTEWPVYYPDTLPSLQKTIVKHSRDPKKIFVQALPPHKPQADSPLGQALYNDIGFLYLPNAYVVPGGIFNEMYGWDSYFIIRGLLQSAAYLEAHPDGLIFVSNQKTGHQPELIRLDKKQAQQRARQLFNLAKGMVDNHIFEIDFYGGFVLNGNRSYYLTRSQPPLFTEEALAVYQFYQKYKNKLGLKYHETLATIDPNVKPYLQKSYRQAGFPEYAVPNSFQAWLKDEVLPAAETYFDYWVKPNQVYQGWNPYNSHSRGHNPRVISDHLYTYGVDGFGEAAETAKSTQEQNRMIYLDAGYFFDAYPSQNPQKYYYNEDMLQQRFYAADRAIRASGFDLSGRYGVQGQFSLDYANVALTSLLYKMAADLQNTVDLTYTGAKKPQVYQKLDKSLVNWRHDVRDAVNQKMWQQISAKQGIYSDALIHHGKHTKALPQHPYLLPYNHNATNSGDHKQYYPYGTMFYPIWAGLASTQQSRAVFNYAGVSLPVQQDQLLDSNWQQKACIKTAKGACETGQMITPFAVQTSLVQTGNQWDYPYAWAPVEFFAAGAVDHLATGKRAEKAYQQKIMQRIQDGWIRTIDLYFAKTGRIIEKYNAVDPLSEIDTTRGYSKAQVGFGWSNALYLMFYQNKV